MDKRIVERGYSIAEMLLVVAVIAIVAAVANPSISDVHVRRLNAASAEAVNALMFARQESLRSGVLHGVRADSVENKLLVFRMDTTQTPALEVYDVPHPVSRASNYEVDLYGDRRTRSTTIQGYFQIYNIATAREAISFNARGEPVDGAAGLPLLAEHGGFVLNNGNRGTLISVARLSGRVQAAEIDASVADPATQF